MPVEASSGRVTMQRIYHCKRARGLGLGAVVAALLLTGLAPPLLAVDTPSSPTAPDLAAVRANIKSKDWSAAIRDLNAMIDQGVQQADVYSLLGFSLRKSGDTAKAYTFYRKALEFEPNHKGALEYLGELYVESGAMAKAREHVRRLSELCPGGCEELDDLKAAIAEAEGPSKTQ
jgi:Flp pilus assembly protein TadD